MREIIAIMATTASSSIRVTPASRRCINTSAYQTETGQSPQFLCMKNVVFRSIDVLGSFRLIFRAESAHFTLEVSAHIANVSKVLCRVAKSNSSTLGLDVRSDETFWWGCTLSGAGRELIPVLRAVQERFRLVILLARDRASSAHGSRRSSHERPAALYLLPHRDHTQARIRRTLRVFGAA